MHSLEDLRNEGNTPTHKRLFWLVFILGWSALVAVTTSFISAATSLPILLALRLALAFWGFYALAAPLVLRLARRFPLGRDSWRRNIWVHLAGTLLFVVLCEGGFVVMTELFDPHEEDFIPEHAQQLRESGAQPAPSPTATVSPKDSGGGAHVGFISPPPGWIVSPEEFEGGLPEPPLRLIAFKAQFGIPFYWVVVGVAHSLAAMVALREREKQAAQLTAHLTQAQLAGLRTQLQPHFLFNTLNSIAALIPQNAKQATEMVMNLSDLLRMTLREPQHAEIPLSEELDLLQHYVEIQRLRFGERLAFHVEVTDDALHAFVPPLLLQPLVENAIRHGLEASDQTERIMVRGSVINQELRLEVANTFSADPDESRLPAESTGFGLANTQARLKVQYGDQHFFDAGPRKEGGFQVTMKFPARLMDAPLSPAITHEN
jgi:Histidine kinase